MGNILAYLLPSSHSENSGSTIESYGYLPGIVILLNRIKLHSVLLSFLFFSILFVIINFIIVSVTTCRRLTMEMEILWTQTMVHFVFALITSPLSIWYLLLENTLSSDIANSATTESMFLICIAIGFMVCEITTLLASKYIISFFNSSMLLQDLVVISGACLLLRYDQGHFFGLLAIAVEGVYVFNSISWMLKQTGSFGTSAWRVLQILTIHLCNYCPLLGIYCLLLSYQQVNSLLDNMPLPFLVVLYTCLITEMFLVIPSWSAKLMEDLQRVKIVGVPSGVYRLCSVSSAGSLDQL